MSLPSMAAKTRSAMGIAFCEWIVDERMAFTAASALLLVAVAAYLALRSS